MPEIVKDYDDSASYVLKSFIKLRISAEDYKTFVILLDTIEHNCYYEGLRKKSDS